MSQLLLTVPEVATNHLNVDARFEKSEVDTFIPQQTTTGSSSQQSHTAGQNQQQQLYPPPAQWRLSDFEVLPTVLGTGSLGKAYLCRLKNYAEVSPFFAMKIMRKHELVRMRLTERVQREAKLHLKVSSNVSGGSGAPSPASFFVSLLRTFTDEKRVYFILELASGGELFARLRNVSRFPLEVAKFYIAEIIVAIEYLHAHERIVFRDLQPDNILLDGEGHVKICDFGNAKCLCEQPTTTTNSTTATTNSTVAENATAHASSFSSSISESATVDNSLRTFTICGVPEYTAPEVVAVATATSATTTSTTSSSPTTSNEPSNLFQGHGFAADWWSVGVILYEMLAGFPPFFDDVPQRIFEKANKASRTSIPFPTWFDVRAKDLICALLVPDPTKRLGALKRGVVDIMKHRFFAGLDWQAIKTRQVAPPEFVRDFVMNSAVVVPAPVLKKAQQQLLAKQQHGQLPLQPPQQQNDLENLSLTATAGTVNSLTGSIANKNVVVVSNDIRSLCLTLPFDRYPDSDGTSNKTGVSLKPLTEAQQAVFAVFNEM